VIDSGGGGAELFERDRTPTANLSSTLSGGGPEGLDAVAIVWTSGMSAQDYVSAAKNVEI
jgi:hypothetical protein